jgi:predicted  nucleic acid-binding Zn-ribbon protein
MAVLTIRDVPEDVRAALAESARERGQSLQAFLLAVLKEQAAFNRNRQIIAEIERDLAENGGVDPDTPNAAEFIAQGRAEREESQRDQWDVGGAT